MSLKTGDQLEVEWCMEGRVFWWPAVVVKVTAKRCTVRYEALAPTFPTAFDETHLYIGGDLVEKGTYGVLRFRRLEKEESATEAKLEETEEETEDEEFTEAVRRRQLEIQQRYGPNIEVLFRAVDLVSV